MFTRRVRPILSRTQALLHGSGTRLGRLAAPLLDALLPQLCCACDRWIPNQRDPLCPTCRAILARLRSAAYCRQCGRTLAPGALRDDSCGLCNREDSWNFAALARIGPYLPPLRHMVLGLKYRGREDHAELLGRWLAEALQATPWLAELDLLLPVPMHPLRAWQRPWNHANELALRVSAWTGVPCELRAVRRVKYTPSQTLLKDRTPRFDNVRKCFAVVRPERLAGRVVCVVDNMLVAGATIHEVVKAVRKAGARRIYVAVAASSVLAADFQAETGAETEAEPSAGSPAGAASGRGAPAG